SNSPFLVPGLMGLLPAKQALSITHLVVPHCAPSQMWAFSQNGGAQNVVSQARWWPVSACLDVLPARDAKAHNDSNPSTLACRFLLRTRRVNPIGAVFVCLTPYRCCCFFDERPTDYYDDARVC